MITPRQGIWGWKIVGYLFLAGLGSGAFGVAAALDLRSAGQTRDLTNLGAWIGLIGVGMGALLLLWDLGVPWRMLRLVGNKSSLISIGTVVLTVLLVLAAIAIAASLFSWDMGATGYRVLIVAAGAFALGTSIYVGFLLAVVKCRPFWNTPMLPLLFVVSALSTGISSLTLLETLGGGLRMPTVATELMASTEIVLLGLELVMVAFYMFAMENSLPQARVAVRRLVAGDLAVVFWVGIVLLGLLLPLALMALNAALASWLGASLVLLGGLCLRYGFLSAGSRTPLPGEAPEAALVLRPLGESHR